MKSIILIGYMLLSVAAFAAQGVTNTWIGGDKSSVTTDTFHVDAYWSTGVAPTNGTYDALMITNNGDFARWITSSSGFYLKGPVTLGDTNTSPRVTVEFLGNRSSPPANSNPAQILAGAKLAIRGSNTTVRIGAGMNYQLGGTASPNLELDPRATLYGDGILQFARSIVLPARNYDHLLLRVQASESSTKYWLAGTTTTTGNVEVTESGTSGVDGLATLSLNGCTLAANTLTLGEKDILTNNGDQSGFGAIDLAGGTLELSGDIVFRSNPDGLKADQTPLTRDSAISSSTGGGTIKIGGSFTNITTKTPASWMISGVDLILNGNGTNVQCVEALSADFGDTPTCCLDNYCWHTLKVQSGAYVQLVDRNDNNRITSDKEAVYVKDLIVESGATLDLNGINVYAYGTINIAGTLVTNGGAATKLTKALGVIRLATTTLGTTDPSYGLGMWIGAMAVGDVTGDGKNEFFVITMDEKPEDDDCKLFALNYTNGVVSSLPNYPISDQKLGAAGASAFYNFIVDDLGNGLGNELHYSNNGYSKVYAIGKNASPHLVSAHDDATYSAGAIAFADLDRDGSKDLICAARGSSNNLRVYNTADQTLKWSATLQPADNNIVVQVGVADLDLDGQLEVFAVAKSTTNGLISAFRKDGSYYYGPTGGMIISNMPLTSASLESFGGLAAADVDGDHYPEFIYAASSSTGNDGLTVMKQNGSVLCHIAGSAPGFALLDVNRDGIYEVLYGDKLCSGDGTVLQTLPVPSGATAVTSYTMPVLADFNGDQIPEAVYLCSTSSKTPTYGRMVCVYDFRSQSILPGFPVALTAILSAGNNDTTWRAGPFHHWYGVAPLVADLDNDGTWEIIVGVGIDTDTTTESPTLNVIATPYRYTVPAGRRVEDYGWYSYRHGPLADFKFPLYVPQATVIFIH